MLRPEHITAQHLAHQKRASSRRTLSIVVVGAIHLLIIYALASGLAADMTAHMIQDVKVAVVKEKPPDVKPPPPPPPDFKVPPPDFVPPPEINIQTDAPQTNAITTVQTKAPVAPAAPPAPPAPAAITPPRTEGRAHECQSKYPPLSQRLSEQGTVGLKFVINADGTVSDVAVEKSSGYSRLDDAATSCAGAWRYHPAEQGGKPISATYHALVKYQLNQ